MKHYEVVVVGAGAAGLTATIELARAGVDVLLLESRAEGSPLPRATVLSLRTMELMRSWGLERHVRAGADEVDMTMLEMPTAARAVEGRRIDVGLPTAAQSAVLSPSAPACVAQDHLEDVLLEHVTTYPTVTLQRGVTVRHVANTGAGAMVTVHGDNGLRTIAADRVVGADGGRSVVRAALGIDMVGPEELFEGFRVEFRAPVWDVVGEHRHLLYMTTEPGANAVLLPAGQGDRWLMGFLPGGAIEPSTRPTTEELVSVVRRVLGVPQLEVCIERVGHFTAGAQLAEQFTRGNVSLVGDAAHRVTPRGGTGLNMAIADGFDLGWKLAWVQRGWASEALLTTYEAERRPAAAHNLQRSAEPTGTRRGTATELDVDLGGRVRHVWAEPGETSTLDLVGEGLTLFTAGAPAWAAVAGSVSCAVPMTVVPLERVVARSFGLGPDGAQLVRPDGVPVAAWWSSVDAREQLCRAVSAFVEGEMADVMAPGTAA
jgi:putative polyketide hydroxylase